MPDNSRDNQSIEVLWGVDAIADAIGRTSRSTYHLLERGHIPAAKKIGGRWCASRRKLLDMFEQVAA